MSTETNLAQMHHFPWCNMFVEYFVHLLVLGLDYEFGTASLIRMSDPVLSDPQSFNATSRKALGQVFVSVYYSRGLSNE